MKRKTQYDVRTYITPFILSETERVEVVNLISAYTGVVNDIVGAIWDTVLWIPRMERRRIVSTETLDRLPSKVRKLLEQRSWVQRTTPWLPSKKMFKTLRCQLIEQWFYSKHFIDGALKDAWSILTSWRSNYIRGVRKRRKPLVRRRFARFKTTMASYRDGVLKLSIRPRRFVWFDVQGLWWLPRARRFLGHRVITKRDFGEILITKDRLIVTVRKRLQRHHAGPVVAWDNNLLSIDGFSPSSGFNRAGLKKVYTLHVTYGNKRRRVQRNLDKKRCVYSRLVRKYEGREQNRVVGELHRITNEVLRRYEGYNHVFEDTGKRWMFSPCRRRNRDISAVDWKRLSRIVGYKANARKVSSRGTTVVCPRCGAKNIVPPIADAVITCGCGLRRDRQRGAALNVYLKANGLFPRGKRVRKSKVLRRLHLIEQWKEELQKPSSSAAGALTLCR
nr:hypothetical protein [Candidatus Njordarchaeota archaeon]